MTKVLGFLIVIAMFALGASAKVLKSSSVDLANDTLTAHGGKKYKEMRTLVVSGAVDITASSF